MTVELALLSRVAWRGREITSPRLRGLLALLADDLPAGRSTSGLIEGLWADALPETPGKALQVLVSRARAQLGPDVIVSTRTGYRLGLDEEAVDASAVLRRAANSSGHARQGDHAAALAEAEAGLALWDGPPRRYEHSDDPVGVLRAERAAAYDALRRSRALSLARLRRHEEALPSLEELFARHPRDEEIVAELVRCEAATAGPSAALERYEAYRRDLRDDLGTGPGAALRAVQEELLREELPPVRHNVPHDPNPLLGRDADLRAVHTLLRASRVTSIVGPGGLGKTRLAHAAAREAEQRVVHLVALAGVDRNGDVAGEVATVLGGGEARRAAPPGRAPGGDPVAAIVDAVATGPVLLVLDNCEQVVEGVAELVGTLVAMTRDLRVLTTSRAPLGLSSEAVYPLPPLDARTAEELFAQRARAARPGVELPGEAVAEVCRHLDGLPLAVELAAARVRVMSVADIARHLDDRFALLRGGARDAPARHQAMRAVVEWSWNLLGPEGRAALRALSIFPGGFTVDAARYLLGDREDEVLSVLEGLVVQSLLQVSEAGTRTRFRMLETVREFSAAHRAAEGETEEAVDGLLRWARAFGAAHHAAFWGADPFSCVPVFRDEQDNLVQALRYGIDRRDGATAAGVVAVLGVLRLVDKAYGRLMTMVTECADVLYRYRPREESAADVLRTALTLCTLCTLFLEGPRATRSLVALRRLPAVPADTVPHGLATVVAAVPEILEPDGRRLRELLARPEPPLAGAANLALTLLKERDGDLEAALAAAERAVDALAGPESPWMTIMTRSRAGELCLQTDRAERARVHMRTVLGLLERLGAEADAVGVRWGMASAALQAGDADEAEYWLGKAVPACADHVHGAATFELGARAEIAITRGRVDEGLRLWRRAVARLPEEESGYSVLGPGMDPWTLEVESAAVAAHAAHGRAADLAEVAAALRGKLAVLLDERSVPQPAFVMDLPICGAVLYALARAERSRSAARAARMIALAERMRFPRNFQPTMAAAGARAAARSADGPAYDAASASYAGLSREELRGAARDLLYRDGSRLNSSLDQT
ncbi:ATP-binding protein [Spirillospora albida]|uniref:ATP-binding protein n=1 Tax=Spirillospora albida TaxID=58123 RepID=UPI0004BF093C|nr:BTAD domain-containing putative transcriptional regulator [Spirillospora albida]